MQKNNEQADSTSSEDEISADILQEITDEQFLNNSLYIKDKSKIVSQSELETNKVNVRTLRLNSKREEKFTNFGFTATFQSFVAKKLDKILDGIIELKNDESIEYCAEQHQKKNEDSGIKLLSSSKKYLTTEVYEKETPKKRKKRRQVIEDDDHVSKFREAAVDPEHILSKSDVKAWANKRPDPEFKYKRLKTGVLIEMK